MQATNIQQRDCPKCGGKGIFKGKSECFDCRASGKMAFVENGILEKSMYEQLSDDEKSQFFK